MWPEKGTSNSNLPLSGRVVEVTLKMVSIPSGPAPTQVHCCIHGILLELTFMNVFVFVLSMSSQIGLYFFFLFVLSG